MNNRSDFDFEVQGRDGRGVGGESDHQENTQGPHDRDHDRDHDHDHDAPSNALAAVNDGKREREDQDHQQSAGSDQIQDQGQRENFESSPHSFSPGSPNADGSERPGKRGKPDKINTAGAINAARARKRIKEGFKELAGLCKCHSIKKPTILTSAVDRLRELKLEVRRLQNQQTVNIDPDTCMPYQERPSILLPMSPENVTTSAIIRSIAQLSRVPAELGSNYHWSEDYQHIFDRGTLCMFVFARSALIHGINGPLLHLLGYTKDEVLGLKNGHHSAPMTVFQLTHKRSLSDTCAVSASLLEKPHSLHRYKKQYLHKDGSLVMALTTSWVSFGRSGVQEWIHSVVELDHFVSHGVPQLR